MKLYANEKLLMELHNHQILLTNKRIRYYHRMSKGYYTSIVLTQISSVSVGSTYKSNFFIWLVIYTIFMGMISLFDAAYVYAFVGIIAMIVFGDLYLSYVKNQVIITAKNGTSISFDLSNIDKEKLSEFLYILEKQVAQQACYT